MKNDQFKFSVSVSLQNKTKTNKRSKIKAIIDDNELHKNTLQNYPDKVTPVEI